MIKKLFKELRRILSNSYRSRLFILFSVLFISSMLVLSCFLTQNSNKQLKKEIYQNESAKLAQVKTFIDAEIDRNFHSVITGNFLDLSSKSSLTDFFTQKSFSHDSQILLSATNTLKTITLDKPYMNSIWLYRLYDDTLLSSREGVIYSLKSREKDYGKIINFELIYELSSENGMKKWIGTVENKDFWGDKHIMSYIQTIPFFSSAEQHLGYVIINLNFDTLVSEMKKSLGCSDNVMIVNSDGDIIAHNQASSSPLPSLKQNEISSFLKDDAGFKILKLANTPFLLTWQKSDWNDWVYISATPAKVLWGQLNAFRIFSYAIVIAILILALIGIKFLSAYLYRPIKSLLPANNSADIVEDSADEFAYINTVINGLNQRVSEMQSTIEKNNELIKYKIAIDILHGNISVEQDIIGRMNIANLKFINDKYMLVIIEINKPLFKELPFLQREYISNTLISTIDSITGKSQPSLTISHPFNCIVSIMNTNSVNLEKNIIPTLEKEFDSFLGQIEYNIEISKEFSSLLELPQIYQNMIDGLKYSFIYGYSNVFRQQELEEFDKNNPDIYGDLLRECEVVLKSNNFECFKQKISTIPDDIRKNGLSFQYAQSIAICVSNLICKKIKEQHIDNEQVEKDLLTDEYSRINSIDEFISWIYDIVDLYAKEQTGKHSPANHEFIQNIMKFIDSNIDNLISLNLVADKFYVSPSHLSRLFKEYSGMNFSEYLIEKKFEKALHLLTECHNVSISEIATELGYSSSAYFNKQFKARYGITPTQYRKHNVK